VVSCQSAQLLTVQELVGLGHGVSLIPRMAVDADKTQRRKYRSLADTKPTRTIALIWRKGRAQSPLVKRFIEAVRKSVAHSNRPAKLPA
jgi:LysR family hydrogen peroxide-inducible transcriptional activator